MDSKLLHQILVPSLALASLLTGCGGGTSSYDPVETQQVDRTSVIDITDSPLANRPPRIGGTPASSVAVGEFYGFVPVISDPDNDPLVFEIQNLPSWLTLDPNSGQLSGIPTYRDVGTVNGLLLTVHDGTVHVQSSPFSISVTMDEVELALASGDVSVVSQSSRLEDAVLSTIDSNTGRANSVWRQIFNLTEEGRAREGGQSLTSIDWYPTHDAAILRSDFDENAQVLISNAVFNADYDVLKSTLGVIGESPSRYMVLGGNPMRNYRRSQTSLNEQMHQFLLNSLAWLVQREVGSVEPLNVVLAQLSQSYYFPDELAVREWLDERLDSPVNYNARNACDGAALAACLDQTTDLLIISNDQASNDQVDVVSVAAEQAMLNGTPVLYLHLDGHPNMLSEKSFRFV